MQDTQHVHLDPRESAQNSAADAVRARQEQEETLRRRKNHAGGGDGVQFSTVFAMVDSSLESGAETLKRIPRRHAQKDVDSEKGSDLPVAAVDVKVQAAEAPKEAPKAKSDQDSNPKPVKEAVAKKSESVAEFLARQALTQSRVDIQVEKVVQKAESTQSKTQRTQAQSVEKPQAPKIVERQTVTRETAAQAPQISRESVAVERRETVDEGRSQDRRSRPKAKETDAGTKEIREERPRTDGHKPLRADEDAQRAPKLREKPESQHGPTERPELRDSKSSDKKTDGGDISDRRNTEEARSADAGARKRSAGDLEKLTNLHARSVVELAPVVMPTQDFAIRPTADAALKPVAVDSARAAVKAAPSTSSSAGQQHAGGAQTQSHEAQGHDKLGQTARRLTSYLSGKTEAPIKPEATFSDMVAKAKLFMDNGRTEMTIQLKPEQLGSLKIQMAVEDGKMEALFITDRPEVKALIEQNADMLKSKLADVGIDVSALNVEVRNDAGQTGDQDGRPSGLRRVLDFGSGDEGGLDGISIDAQVAYALAGMGTHLSLVA